MKTPKFIAAVVVFCAGLPSTAEDHWHQPAGPNGNWQVEGTPPLQWSVTRNENGQYLFLPVVTGTVYVIDTEVKSLTPDALVAVNDLGPGGETWTLATVTFAKKRLYAHTMKEIICIEADKEKGNREIRETREKRRK